MNTQKIVTIDKDVLHGTPVFTGTRVPVQSLIDHVVAGDGLDEFSQGFSTVSRAQAEAFLKLEGWSTFFRVGEEVAKLPTFGEETMTQSVFSTRR